MGPDHARATPLNSPASLKLAAATCFHVQIPYVLPRWEFHNLQPHSLIPLLLPCWRPLACFQPRRPSRAATQDTSFVIHGGRPHNYSTWETHRALPHGTPATCFHEWHLRVHFSGPLPRSAGCSVTSMFARSITVLGN